MEEEFIKGLVKQTYSTYFKVIGKFPEIKKDEIQLGYDSSVAYARQAFYEDLSTGDAVPKAVLLIGPYFFELDDGEKEAIIAHELGHYIREKKYSFSKLERLSDWFRQLEFYYKKKDSEEKVVITFSDKKKRRIKKIQNCYNTHEVYADNEAVKRGYGKQVLSALEKITEKQYDRLTQMCKEAIKIRIKRLKSSLEKKF